MSQELTNRDNFLPQPNEGADEGPRSLSESKELKNQAMQMYYAGLYVTEIVEYLNIEIEELRVLVFGKDGSGYSPVCWSQKKLQRPEASFVTYEKVKPLLLKRTESKLVRLIDRSLTHINDEETNLSMDDCSKAASIIEKFDKITRLEEGKATSHIAMERRTFTLREIVENSKQERENSTQEIENEKADEKVIEVSSREVRPGERHAPPEYGEEEKSSS